MQSPIISNHMHHNHGGITTASAAAAAASKKKKQSRKAELACENGTTGLDVDMKQHIEVYSAVSDELHVVPRSDIFHIPQQLNKGGAAADGKKLQLCPQFDATQPETSCPNGTKCKFVHARLANSVRQDVHVNYAWNSPEEVTYTRFPEGDLFHIALPNESVPKDEVPSHLVLKTRAFESNRRAISHCAHYYFNRVCNRGSACFFIHAVSLAPLKSSSNNNKQQSSSSSSTTTTTNRRSWGRTQALPPHLQAKAKAAKSTSRAAATAAAATAAENGEATTASRSTSSSNDAGSNCESLTQTPATANMQVPLHYQQQQQQQQQQYYAQYYHHQQQQQQQHGAMYAAQPAAKALTSAATSCTATAATTHLTTPNHSHSHLSRGHGSYSSLHNAMVSHSPSVLSDVVNGNNNGTNSCMQSALSRPLRSSHNSYGDLTAMSSSSAAPSALNAAMMTPMASSSSRSFTGNNNNGGSSSNQRHNNGGLAAAFLGGSPKHPLSSVQHHLSMNESDGDDDDDNNRLLRNEDDDEENDNTAVACEDITYVTLMPFAHHSIVYRRQHNPYSWTRPTVVVTAVRA